MEKTEKKQQNKIFKLERFAGIILLIAPIIGIVVFILNVLYNFDILEFYIEYRNSTDSIYLGLMAIAGAYLLKKTNKKR